MLHIGVLAGGGHDDVARQLANVASVEPIESADALRRRAAEGTFDAVVTGLRDERGRSMAATVVTLAATRPALPVVLHTRITLAALAELQAVLAPGLRLECAVRPFIRLAPLLRRMLSPAYRPGVAPLLLPSFLPRVPDSLAVFVALAILTAPERRRAEELAAWSGVTPRTIERRLRRARLPPAHVIVQSFVALDAVWLMTEYGWSARLVQLARAFPHASSVTRLLGRYAATRPSTVVEDGGFAAALERVDAVLFSAHDAGG